MTDMLILRTLSVNDFLSDVADSGERPSSVGPDEKRRVRGVPGIEPGKNFEEMVC
jgi:hypothetical protein